MHWKIEAAEIVAMMKDKTAKCRIFFIFLIIIKNKLSDILSINISLKKSKLFSEVIYAFYVLLLMHFFDLCERILDEVFLQKMFILKNSLYQCPYKD